MRPKTGLIFCTACLSDLPSRYRDWVNYYKAYFKDSPIHLILVNDGPLVSNEDWCVPVISFPEQLGRRSVWVFPGWKRSFHAGLMYGCEHGYERIAHIEADCWLRKKSKKTFLEYLDQPGYYTGSLRDDYPETALQILNCERTLNWFCKRYMSPESWYENINFEKTVKHKLAPIRFFSGERHEGHDERFKPEHDYVAQATLADFQRLVDGEE